MGVTGLWRLIEPAGKPVPVETLENKVLAVDISIWLHQMVKGYQDAKGAPIPNAHLMGLFQRLCKLLYFRIKPVFVFDGAFPELKKETIMQRLLKRRKVQECLEETEKEMGDTGMSLNDLESLLNEEGIDTKIDTLPTKRIASNVSTRFLLIRDVKKALAEAKQRNQAQNNPTTSKIEEINEKDEGIKATTSKDTEITEIKEESPKKLDELEDDLQKAIQMSLECVDEPKQDTSVVSKTDDSWTSCMTDTDYSDTDSEEGDGFEQPDMTCAKAYIMQYSDFTHQAIDKIVTDRHKDSESEKNPEKPNETNVDNAANTVIQDNVEPAKSSESPDVIVEPEKQNHLIKAPNLPKQTLTTEQLTSMVEDIQNEEQDLMQEKGRLDRIGRNITEQMTKEAQELLQIFGIPYIVAPMEAEAQCAFLESVNLTDGTITDDSDIWLFGGRTVYKNFFNQKKHVLQFLAERIEKSFNLNREQLILLALLVGSDYTTGLSGVGPVTAMEILASFPFNKRQLLSEESKQARYAQMVKGLKNSNNG
ncbi:unnamed protein product [Spodoptera littoralis]|uniref:Uncharacterized protein n=1 Tax=Spodoptera littoralis TaxID=7109 RepID=A0A9P0ID97_SPOLI|nr:unnamed protein product [Spodoptera littoralis]CAH1644712.1 unnamed protein product [Spodoptera littoralis]